MDVMLICPVFVDGELFCWVTNCLHQYDVGGITPSSFCPSARDAYDEGILIPPIKIVEGGEIRKDVEAMYLRASRKPDVVALDFRAQLAGNNTAKARVLKLVERYGARTVKSVMKRVIANGEKAFLAKMDKLPDGTWQERAYVECAHVGDRKHYPVMITLKKEGSRLTFENEGTAPQIGAMNCTYSGWRGSIMVVLNQILCWEQYFAIGGALRHVDFNPTLGTMNCADFPASVSTAPIQAMEMSLYPVYNVLSKMIYPVPELRGDIVCMSGTSQWPGTLFQGTDLRGEKFGYGLIDPIGGAIGAFAGGDGVSTGGQSRTPISKLPNVEHTEQQFPILYLYRKELPDSGGGGRFRGGQGAESCFVVHNSDRIMHDSICSGAAIPSSLGLMGGHPAGPNGYRYKVETDVRQRFARGEVPRDVDEVEGRVRPIGLREHGFPQTGRRCLCRRLVRRRRLRRSARPRARTHPGRPGRRDRHRRGGGADLRRGRGCEIRAGRRGSDGGAAAAHEGGAAGGLPGPGAAEARGAEGAGNQPLPCRASRRAGTVPCLQRVRHPAGAAGRELEGPCLERGGPGAGEQPAARRPAPLYRRRGALPPLSLPGLRHAA